MLCLYVSNSGDLEAVMRRMYSISGKTSCRVWYRFMSRTYELLQSDPFQTLQDAGLYNMQVRNLAMKLVRNK